jgi:hypothetical protein
MIEALGEPARNDLTSADAAELLAADGEPSGQANAAAASPEWD